MALPSKAHSGPAMPGFSCGHEGPPGVQLQTENNVYKSGPPAKCYCWDMTRWPDGTFKICQTDGSKMRACTHEPTQQLDALHCPAAKTGKSPDPGIARRTFPTRTLHSLILMCSTRMIIRFSANERERATTWVGRYLCQCFGTFRQLA